MKNPFADDVLVNSTVVASDNPYAVPVESWKGEYDWTLAKRVFLWFAAMAGFYLLCSGVASWQSFSKVPTNQYRSPIEQIQSYFLDWQQKPTAQP